MHFILLYKLYCARVSSIEITISCKLIAIELHILVMLTISRVPSDYCYARDLL